MLSPRPGHGSREGHRSGSSFHLRGAGQGLQCPGRCKPSASSAHSTHMPTGFHRELLPPVGFNTVTPIRNCIGLVRPQSAHTQSSEDKWERQPPRLGEAGGAPRKNGLSYHVCRRHCGGGLLHTPLTHATDQVRPQTRRLLHSPQLPGTLQFPLTSCDQGCCPQGPEPGLPQESRAVDGQVTRMPH